VLTPIPQENFAEELRAWRERLGLSQAELGARMGYSGSHVSSVETMARVPRFEFAKKADEAQGVPGTFRRLHGRITREAHPPWFAPFVHLEDRLNQVEIVLSIIQKKILTPATSRAWAPSAMLSWPS
jgi:transcriptional regulator with XRE-family HTH domain